jgi:signal transduction histidine kinase
VTELLRNRELLFFAIGAAVITSAAIILCQFPQIPAVVVCVSGCASVSALAFIYTLRRYRDIARLSSYLQKLSHGEKALDVRDNEEGELSILKNEIYKVTVSLTDHADELAKEKKELAGALADISHQLKTPLTAMGVMADLLDGDELSAETRREFIGKLRFSLNRMEWLVLALLKLARLDAGAVNLKREPITLSALVERALLPLSIPIELREQTLSISGQDANVICDPDWTSEAVGNILKNAVENTPEGGRIEIIYGSNPLYSFISIHDGGSGIDKADMPHLFKRFYQGRNAGRDSVGIGLSMSLAIMRKQNGDVEASNDNGGVFTLKF